VDPGEACDGADLNGYTCQELGYDSGTLACAVDCAFDTTDCFMGGTCGNGLLDPGEACDGADLNGYTCQALGYDSGTLACAADCTFDTTDCFMGGTCGNGLLDPGEQCDGQDLAGESCVSLGYDSGQLACGPNCLFDTGDCRLESCGNGVADLGEACDGADLNGRTCQDLGFESGQLSCAMDCSFDTSACSGQLWYLFEDFESGALGWTLMGDWQIGAPALEAEPSGAHSPTQCAGTVIGGDYSDDNTFAGCGLISPPIDLTDAADPMLDFYFFMSSESGFDGGNLWISIDGQNWIYLTDESFTTPYNDVVMQGYEVWGGERLSGRWHRMVTALDAYAGQEIRLRFSFASDSSVSDRMGWYVDDILIAEGELIPLSITSPSDLGITLIDNPFSHMLQAVGGSGDRVWEIVGGSNHGWLSLQPDTGRLSGTPTAAHQGSAQVTVRVTEAGVSQNFAEKTFWLDVVDGYYYESFDNGAPADWEFEGDWQWGVPTTAGPSGCYGGSSGCVGTVIDGAYTDYHTSWDACCLRSPELNLTFLSSPLLTFYQYYHTETHWDGGTVWVSQDGGVSWMYVERSRINPPYSINNVGPPGQKKWAFSGQAGSYGWEAVTVDLSPHVGGTVQVRYCLYSDGSINEDGWYLDEVMLVD
jgi:hypothetical protein